MSYQIINDITSLKIVGSSGEIAVAKDSIKDVSVLRGSVIKIGTGDCMRSIYIKHSEISDPITPHPNNLLDVINDMLTPSIDTPPGR